MKLWFVDDRQDNHRMWESSFPESVMGACELRSFYAVPDLLDELDSGHLPDILFLDFFIGECLGTDVIKWFGDRQNRPVLIAHSSMYEANVGMVREGADFYLEKIKGGPHTESIRNAFQSIEDLNHIVQRRAKPEGR